MQDMIRSPHKQQGSMLLEALVAILIFSLGIIAIVGLQATSIKLSTDAKHRFEASMLANQLIGQMWVSDRTASTLKANFDSGQTGGNYTTWLANVQSTLPGVAGSYLPSVTVSDDPATQGQVTITLYWKMPGEHASAPPHQYIAIAQIQ